MDTNSYLGRSYGYVFPMDTYSYLGHSYEYSHHISTKQTRNHTYSYLGHSYEYSHHISTKQTRNHTYSYLGHSYEYSHHISTKQTRNHTYSYARMQIVRMQQGSIAYAKSIVSLNTNKFSSKKILLLILLLRFRIHSGDAKDGVAGGARGCSHADPTKVR